MIPSHNHHRSPPTLICELTCYFFLVIKQNPFIVGAKSKSIIGSLVDECMTEIEEYRKADTEGANNEEEEAPASGTGGGAGHDTGTMISPGGTGGAVDSGTMVVSGGSGTMVQKPKKVC
jgi:hypothetical protein